MGGSLGAGNTTAAAEFNIWADPEAAAIVFESGIPIRMSGLDVTHQALVLPADIARLEGLGTRPGRVFADLMRFFAIHHRERYGWDGPPIHDAVAVAWLADPDLVVARSVRVDVETGRRPQPGPHRRRRGGPVRAAGQRRGRHRRSIASGSSTWSSMPSGGSRDPRRRPRATSGSTRRIRRSSPIRIRSIAGCATSTRSCGTRETGQWLLSRHADVNRLLRDRRLGRTYLHQATHAEMGRPEPPAWHAPFHELNDAGMLDLEPPDHTRIRRLVLKAFTPRTVEAMRTADPGDRRRADRRLRRAPARSTSSPTSPSRCRSRSSPSCWASPRRTATTSGRGRADMCLMYELNPSDDSARRAVQASVEFGAYLRDLAGRATGAAGRRPDQRAGGGRRRRRHADRERAGRDLRPPPQRRSRGVRQRRRQRLVDALPPPRRAGPPARRARASLPTAIEELLRFDTPLSLFERWVLEPIEIDGVEIPRGGEVALLFGSANRDPAAFARPGRARPRPRPEPVPVVRGRDPLLPRRAAGQAGAAGSPSRRCSAGSRGSSSSRRRAGSRRSCCAASRRCACGSDRCATSRSATRTRSGRACAPAERWPDQLVAALGRPRRPTLELVANLGVNGYTSADLIRDELPALDDLRPEFVDACSSASTTSSRACRPRRTRRTSSRSSTRSWSACPRTAS